MEAADPQQLADAVRLEMGRHMSIDMFLARPGSEYTGGSITAGTPRFTLAGGSFGLSDIGSKVIVPGALGALANPLVGTIQSIVSDTQVDLSVQATATVSGVAGAYGPDCYEAIITALEHCRKRNVGALLIPSGLWINAGGYLPVLSNLDIYGRGRSSIIYAANYQDSGFYAYNQERVSYRGLSFKSHGAVRSERSTTSPMWNRNCQQIDVESLFVDGGVGAGMFSDGCASVCVRNVEVRNTKADGIHIVGGSDQVIVDGVRGYNTGDDTVAVVSYLSQPQTKKVNVENVISVNSRTRGVTVGGAQNVLISGCQVFSPGAHGILVAYESGGAVPAAQLHTPSKVNISHCRVEGALGALTPPEGFNAVLVTGDATHVVDDVTISNCTVIGSNQWKITFASNVRVMGCEIRDSRFNGVIVENSSDVDFLNNKLKNIEGAGLTYVRVTDGQISGNRFTDCQTLNEFGVGASTGRIHIIDSTDVYGNMNRDKRSSTTPSYGPILVSGGSRVHVGVTEIDTDATDANYRVKGLEHDALSKQIFIDTNRPVNNTRYALVSERGVYVNDGDIHIDQDGKFLGSGGAAWLSLFSGFLKAAAASSIQLAINLTNSGAGNTFTITGGSAETLLLTVNLSGDVFARGGFRPSNTNSGHGIFAFSGGSPNGSVAAPVGSLCVVDAGDARFTLYLKVSGAATASGWVLAPWGDLIPTDGTAGMFLQKLGASSYGFRKVFLDNAAQVQMPGATDRPVKVGAGGGLWADPINGQNANEFKLPGIPDNAILAASGGVISYFTLSALAGFIAADAGFIASMKGALAHTHDYQDSSSDGTTGDGGDPSHSHSVSNTASVRVSSGPNW